MSTSTAERIVKRHLTVTPLTFSQPSEPQFHNYVAPPIKPSQTLAQPLPTFNQFTLLADDNIDDDEQPPTATAYSVLDHETGETLEHRQL
jgi:hypothetical protein